MKRIVLAFSGDRDSSRAVSWLSETKRADVVTLTLDLGLGPDPAEIRERAIALGVARAHVVDVRESFATECLLPALRTGALADAERATAGELARPLLARHLVEICRLERATIVAHALTGADREALEGLVRAIDPTITILAPAENWSLTEKHADEGTWPIEAPDTPATVDLTFEDGVPVEISGVPMNVAELIQCLDTIAGGHGVGRDGGHGVPALIVLHAAHQALQESGPADDPVTGQVRLELFQGDCRVLGRHVMA